VIPSDAYVRFSADRAAEVDASLHLTGSSFIHCCTYIADLERCMTAQGTAAKGEAA
jgi:hypothetical protein